MKLKAKGLCSKHYMQQWRTENLELSTYLNLKHNANRRNKEFNLTFEEFSEFAKKFEYLAGKGRKKKSLHIDRINEKLGYSIDNIQVLTNSENVSKWLDYYWDEIERSMNFKFKSNEHLRKSKSNYEYPF